MKLVERSWRTTRRRRCARTAPPAHHDSLDGAARQASEAQYVLRARDARGAASWGSETRACAHRLGRGLILSVRRGARVECEEERGCRAHRPGLCLCLRDLHAREERVARLTVEGMQRAAPEWRKKVVRRVEDAPVPQA
jgi:hypothetical protein